MPAKPSSRPIRPLRVIRSSPQTCPMSIENSGIVPTKIAAIAVPIRGVARFRPMSCPATVVAPITTSGTAAPKRSRAGSPRDEQVAGSRWRSARGT